MIDNKTIRKVIMLNKMLPSGSPTYENREAEGAVANFTTNTVQPFVSLDCEILPIQEGTGTPSPSNPRPISGTSVLDIYHSGADTSEYDTTLVSLGQEIIGGTADVVGGTGEETHDIIDLGDLTWTYRTDVLSVPCFLSNDISDIKNGSLPLACSCFKIMSPNRTAINGNYQVSIGNNTNAKYLVIRYDEYSDGTAVKTALTGQKLVYELATPTDFTFTGQPINSYLGVNNVWTDSGNTKVTYKYKTGEGGSSTKKYLPIFYDLYGKEKYHDHS